jgi:hypothetical protein
MGKRRDVYRFLVEKFKVERPLGRPGRRWENNMNLELQEVGCECLDWINIISENDQQDAAV